MEQSLDLFYSSKQKYTRELKLPLQIKSIRTGIGNTGPVFTWIDNNFF